jgi:adenine-specific DNA-methyltransferase
MKLYAFTTPGIPENAGYLKIGETNGSVDKRIKDQGHTLNTPVVKVWEDAVITERSCIDKRLHLYLREQGFHNPKYPDTGEYTELIKCTVNDLKKAFDVVKQQIYNEEKQREYVGKQFYLEIRNWFYWTANAENASYSVTKAEYSLRLVIRLLLCFFLQEKELVPRELFDEQWIRENMKENEEYRYYNGILRNLFFHCLNIPVRNRKDFENTRLMKNIIKVKEQFQKIPFLNGGLFNEQEGDDTQLSNRYFFEERHTETIPELGGDCKVEGIVRILSKYQYKLTLDNLFDHAEYSQTIDPEFIGKVFESLLSCVDADTKENRRKITGSYYTPREIVDYMVGGALDAYLQNNNNLLQCKILDPACGSGAFPCGIMNEIVHRLDPDKLLSQLERYHIKLKILQNVIYGVDIQPMATQITVLRLFLALIQEITPDKKRENYGIEPLPNLEMKFVCANTLIGLKKEKQKKLELPIIKTTVKQLQETRNQYLTARTLEEKERLQKYDESLRSTLSVAMEDAGSLTHETAELVLQWNPYNQAKSSPFFDSVWMFGVEKFDIVIGNPPYLKEGRVSKSAFDGVRSMSYYQGKMDLWYVFACMGIDFLKQNGHLCFIATNNWVTSNGASKLRNKVITDTQIKQLLDFGNFMIFENASIQTMVMLFSRNNITNNYNFDYRKLQGNTVLDDTIDLLGKKPNPKATYLRPKIIRKDFKDTFLNFSSNENDTILVKIIEKGSCLTENEIANGIHPHHDFVNNKLARLHNLIVGQGIFGLSDKEKNDLQLSADELKLIKPYYTTDQIHRYYSDPKNNLWLIYADSSFKKLNSMDHLPNLKKHLDKYATVITSDNKPYGLHRARDEKFFKGEKVIVQRKCVGKPSFSYSDFDCYVSATFYVIKTNRFNHKYLTGLLNSKLIAFWLKNKGKMQGNNYQLDKEPLLQIPIFNATKNQQQPIISLVDKILSKKQRDSRSDTSQLEAEVDAIVFHLYGLTESEIITVLLSLNTNETERRRIQAFYTDHKKHYKK